MKTQPPSPIWSVTIYSIVILTAVALLWNRVPTFRPDAALMVDLGWAAALLSVGFLFFGGRFVKPTWKLYGKMFAFMTLSYFLFIWLGNWAWPWLILHQGIGWVFHIIICNRYGINWVAIEPRQKYLTLIEKYGRGDFSKTEFQ